MITNDFYGKKGFIWWVGIVEDILDPLKIGSVRVRIIGIHSNDKSLVPTDTLPWAQVSLPPTGAKSASGPRAGDWVWGFFQDGENAQIPVVLGVFSGLESLESQTVYQEFTRKASSREHPTFPAGQIDRQVGDPVVSRLSRGIIAATGIEYTNSNRSHVCDISPEVKKAVAWAKIKFGYIVEQIRNAIKKFWEAYGSTPNPYLRALASKIKEFAQELKKISDFIQDEILPWAQIIDYYARFARAMLNYILSLPERVRKFLLDCLKSFTDALVSGVKDLLNINGVSTNTDMSELVNSVAQLRRETVRLGQNTIAVVSIPANTIKAFTDPSSPQMLLQAEASLLTFVEQNTPSQSTVTENTTYEQQPNPV